MRRQSNTPDDLNELFEEKWELWSSYQDQINALHKQWMLRLPEAGYIYLAQMSGADIGPDTTWRVKIGRTRNLTARLRDLNRFPVVMPFIVYMNVKFWAENAAQIESFLHGALADYRVGGEWFDIPDDIMNGFLDIWYADDYFGYPSFHTITRGACTFDQVMTDAREALEKNMLRAASCDWMP